MRWRDEKTYEHYGTLVCEPVVDAHRRGQRRRDIGGEVVESVIKLLGSGSGDHSEDLSKVLHIESWVIERVVEKVIEKL